MKTMAMRLVIAVGLLVLPVLGMGCDASEPEGSCTTRGFNNGSNDLNEGGDYETCQPHVTASACTTGTFQEGDDCALFDFFHGIAAN